MRGQLRAAPCRYHSAVSEAGIRPRLAGAFTAGHPAGDFDGEDIHASWILRTGLEQADHAVSEGFPAFRRCHS